MMNSPFRLRLRNTDKDTPPTIPVGEAMARAYQWRQLVQSIYTGTADAATHTPVPSQCIFRAIHIDMDDIIFLREQHPDAKSIRVYLSIADPSLQLQITGMLVPVDYNNRDMIYTQTPDARPESALRQDASVSTVYDFTQPCPTLCDPQSLLFSEVNDATAYLPPKA
ncbi:hypothetical protein GA0116948_110127 [Chitinophaga costaii]|uniref:Uncharacterized protein n=1 Tax=Chitinophaga costaii TaxID=1335309 RepID=A0A1C4EYN1_9BACT|nr:hypothetical protein [Chitinophaga costaii]SCC48757.1 hypothetical protein GA0116948_110127 [Chitinophaga costaii]